MKKILCCLIALMMLMTGFAFADDEQLGGAVLGGWTVTSEEEMTLDEETLAVFEQAFDGFVGSKVTPVALLGTQVVSGTNYCFLCHTQTVTLEPVEGFCLVYIYQSLEGETQVLAMVDLDIAAMMEN